MPQQSSETLDLSEFKRKLSGPNRQLWDTENFSALLTRRHVGSLIPQAAIGAITAPLNIKSYPETEAVIASRGSVLSNQATLTRELITAAARATSKPTSTAEVAEAANVISNTAMSQVAFAASSTYEGVRRERVISAQRVHGKPVAGARPAAGTTAGTERSQGQTRTIVRDGGSDIIAGTARITFSSESQRMQAGEVRRLRVAWV